ncbi:MAG TPA: bifunctional 4-hydroxy-2-oxoglutarate aldolase/2-dehydro-3-deoxy-phosphogluconate aldolase [Alphaproteobacteria bacterium]|nr:bifunctional 4-hydroxy-2-oxoglutarate aldolase/2-dehydro-3-deoxy-phosphogluconate aldolase [Alphaproteobacteria bacterium]
MADSIHSQSPEVAAILARAPVIPVLTVDDTERAVALARALVAGGLSVIEITLRTGRALEAARAIIGEVEGAVVGIGTVLSPRQMHESRAAGARFAVSPGATLALLEAAAAAGLPYLPGAATASEVMALLARGYRHLKFFPAENAGGVAALRALAAPFRDVRFCPTGGIDAMKAPAYLALPNVMAVGGSWVAPADRVAAGDWAHITALARAAAALARQVLVA